jgi:hypothetical protein
MYHIKFQYASTVLEKCPYIAVRARRLLGRHLINDPFNLSMREVIVQLAEIVVLEMQGLLV